MIILHFGRFNITTIKETFDRGMKILLSVSSKNERIDGNIRKSYSRFPYYYSVKSNWILNLKLLPKINPRIQEIVKIFVFRQYGAK